MAAFSWEGGGALPQNSYKPTKDQGDAIMHRRTISVQQLSRSFGTHTQRSCYFKHFCYLLLYLDINLNLPCSNPCEKQCKKIQLL